MFVSASVGFCALSAIIRGLRGDAHMGNFYVDMWRVVVYMFLPASLVMGVMLLADGVPMTLEPAANVATLEAGSMGNDDNGQPKPQQICRGPVAAIIPIKHLGTNGGGFFGANSAHPFENPSAWSQLPHRDEYVPVPLHPGADVRADAQTDAARLGDLRRHDVAHGPDDRVGRGLGHLAAQPGLCRPMTT